jgi:MFS family permease
MTTVPAATTSEIEPTAMERAYRHRWLVLTVLCISVFMVVVDNLIINVALPTLQRDLGASTTALQWIVDSYALVFAGLLLAGAAAWLALRAPGASSASADGVAQAAADAAAATGHQDAPVLEVERHDGISSG